MQKDNFDSVEPQAYCFAFYSPIFILEKTTECKQQPLETSKLFTTKMSPTSRFLILHSVTSESFSVRPPTPAAAQLARSKGAYARHL